ncbi:hypothetical protein F4V57_00045 [Acinetobacter qingfengensis]|uniref:Trimeric autotransporter adhesin YadA-like C-terminal membrane anchor domain-containing protein n=1 Tax=Acinetobacter qingfengensis TaxID=1262585 RepID=A0A1E7R5H5_9GAMM|nr:YadA-like family protein [Acinetobacter qingfengensis]KAA8735232.1 hypothetical protein F4V57_00045 [Acinetobacter qingfengensis]OEY94619.1 hypothetical protein BJI46_13465 [Acinetobacter qingfengensis]
MRKTFYLSGLAIALTIAATGIYAETVTVSGATLASNANDIAVNVNSDDGSIGNFYVTNGSANTVTTLNSALTYTRLTSYTGTAANPTEAASLTLNSSGVTLADGSGNALQLTGVADATLSATSTDAVNGSQLYATNQSISNLNDGLTAETAARIAGDAATLVSANAYTDTAVATETAARIAGDAATLTSANNYTDTKSTETLAAANAYTDTRVNNLANRLDDVEKAAYRGTAIALAAQQQVPNIKPGQIAVFGGAGHYKGETAGALGIVSALADGRTSVSAALGVAGGGEVGGRVGLAYVFGGN